MRFMLGVDEAGRGPLAGPVAVGVVAAPEGFDIAKEFPGVADSKKLSPKKREEIFALLLERTVQGDVRFTVEFEDATSIDTNGIATAVRTAVNRGIYALHPDPESVRVLLDGLLKAPPEYIQETIVRGDESVPIISLASIAAKVTRDKFMTELSSEYPLYGFEGHKGYGTKAHYEALEKYGISPVHRHSFVHLDFMSKK
jgi:ribonuclease HII